jgi:hypothetical protein
LQSVLRNYVTYRFTRKFGNHVEAILRSALNLPPFKMIKVKVKFILEQAKEGPEGE